jgi:predicted nucleotidyltransferase
MQSIPRINTVEDIRRDVCTLLNDPYFQPVVWVGLFGSMSRGTHTDSSDVDLIFGYNARTNNIYSVVDKITTAAEQIFNRPVELLHLVNPKVDAYLLLEALLTSITVYGSDQWPKSLRESSLIYLNEGYLRLKRSYQLLKKMDQLVSVTSKAVDFLLGDC